MGIYPAVIRGPQRREFIRAKGPNPQNSCFLSKDLGGKAFTLLVPVYPG